MKVTSAVANKMIRSLNEEIANLLQIESEACTYSEINGEAISVNHNYTLGGTYDAVSKLMRDVVTLKHAVNSFNSMNYLPGVYLTIDAALVRMAQLSKLKERYRTMMQRPERKLNNGYNSNGEIICLNYTIEDATELYKQVSDELMQIQTQLDLVNNTVQFDVNIDSYSSKE